MYKPHFRYQEWSGPMVFWKVLSFYQWLPFTLEGK